MQGQVNKAAFVRAVGFLLQAADVGVEKVVLYDDETALVMFESGAKKQVDITCDSRAAIILDITKAVM